jgi:hypothetical protein
MAVYQTRLTARDADRTTLVARVRHAAVLSVYHVGALLGGGGVQSH